MKSLYCSCQAYAGFFYVARALTINGTSDLDEFKNSISHFCNTKWNVVSPTCWYTFIVIERGEVGGGQKESSTNLVRTSQINSI